MNIVNSLKKGTRLDIATDGSNIFLLSPSGLKVDITSVLNEKEVEDILFLGKAKAIVRDNENIDPLYFVQLHTHTEYSQLDGLSKIKDIAKKSSGITAISDHGNGFGLLEWQKAMKKEGKYPLFAIELYTEPMVNNSEEKVNYHLLLIAKNEKGLKNLYALTSKAYENFYKKPRISKEMLLAHSEGLICTSACIGGELASTILSDYELAKEVALFYRGIFGEDFYIEIQRHNIEAEKQAEKQLLTLAKELNIKIVAGNDSHYLNKEDSVYHDILLCISSKKNIHDEDRFRFDGEGYWFKTDAEMVEDFKDIPEAILSTMEIADKCNVNIKTGEYHLPLFPIPAPFSSDVEYFSHLVDKGFEERFKGTEAFNNPVYRERLAYEKEVILKMGYQSYFLIVWDYISYAKENDIVVGVGRGSACGSLVAYSLKITDLDPIPHGLLFERFLNPDRVSMPDIDTDFCFERREEVIEYCRKKYGDGYVSNIITFGRLQARQSIKDCCRVLGYEYSLGEKLSSLVGTSPSIEDALNGSNANPELVGMYESDNRVREIMNTAKNIEGNVRNTSIHACGVVISDKPIIEYMPTALNSGVLVTQHTMVEVEELGSLKMDFLGLRTATVIGKSLKVLKRKNLEDFLNYREIPLNDPYVYAEISKGKSFAVFQIESEGMRGFMSQLFADVKEKISKLEETYNLSGFGNKIIGEGNKEEYLKAMERFGDELFERMIAGISLYRPGPMDYIPEYIKGMNNPEEIVYDIPALKPILQGTYGVIVYQEQVMQIVKEIAGFSNGQADIIRKAMGKKKQAILDEYKDYFLYGSKDAVDKETGNLLNITGCVPNGIEESIASKIWDKMADFAKYAFNKSHAGGYSVLTVVCAWLKYYYPAIYMSAMCDTYIDKTEKLKGYISVAKNMGIKILPPKVNSADIGFSSDGRDITFGLKGLKGLNKNCYAIIEEREKNGEFTSFEDFIYRTLPYKVNKKTLTSLILTGAFDEFPCSRKAKMDSLEATLKSVKKKLKNGEQLSLFEDIAIIPDTKEYSEKELLDFEEEYSGMYISKHPLDIYLDILKEQNITELSLIIDEDGNVDVGNHTIAGVITDIKIRYTKKDARPMAEFTVSDRSSSMKCIVFPDDYDAYFHLLSKKSVVMVKGSVKDDTGWGIQLIAKTIIDLNHLPNTDVVEEIVVNLPEDYLANKVNYILSRHIGETTVKAILPSKEVKEFMCKVNPSASLYFELGDAIGTDNVSFL